MAKKPTPPAVKRKTLAEQLGRTPTKAEKFVHLAEQRMTKALKAIKQLANLSAKGSYEYTEEQAQEVVDALDVAVESVTARFTGAAVSKAEGFKFSAPK